MSVVPVDDLAGARPIDFSRRRVTHSRRATRSSAARQARTRAFLPPLVPVTHAAITTRVPANRCISGRVAPSDVDDLNSARRIPTRSCEKIPRKRAHSNARRVLPHWLEHASAWVVRLHSCGGISSSRLFARTSSRALHRPVQ